MLIFDLKFEINSLYKLKFWLTEESVISILCSASEHKTFSNNQRYVHCKFFFLGEFFTFTVDKSMTKFIEKL
jgi:hypothetical protein